MRRRAPDILDHRALLLGAAVLAPSIVVTAATGDAPWARGGVIAMSALIASERSGLAPIGVAAQGAAIVAGLALLLAVALHPSLSATSIAALAGGCFVVTARGQRLRSLAAFTFIPILYAGFEAREGAAGTIVPALRSLAAVTTLATAPVVLVAAIHQHRARTGGYARHMTRFMRWSDHGARESAGRAVLAVMMGTAAAALLGSWLDLPHGQWMVWSAASVISAEAVLRKLGDRVVGALIGVPVGIGIGQVVPASAIVVGAATTAGLLTLTAIRPYRLAFATRCGCVALALVVSHQSGVAAAEWLESVVLGGVIGLAAFGLVMRPWAPRAGGGSGTNCVEGAVPQNRVPVDIASDVSSFPLKEQPRA